MVAHNEMWLGTFALEQAVQYCSAASEVHLGFVQPFLEVRLELCAGAEVLVVFALAADSDILTY